MLENLRARSNSSCRLRTIVLAQTHRAGSGPSCRLRDFKKKKSPKIWASYVTLSWRSNMLFFLNLKSITTGVENTIVPAQGHRAGSTFLCFQKKLSQLPGIERVTKSEQEGKWERMGHGKPETYSCFKLAANWGPSTGRKIEIAVDTKNIEYRNDIRVWKCLDIQKNKCANHGLDKGKKYIELLPGKVPLGVIGVPSWQILSACWTSKCWMLIHRILKAEMLRPGLKP